MARPGPEWSRRATALAKSIAFATFAVYAVYLVAANVILRTRLLRGWLRADDGGLLVTYGSARSLLPGHVVIDDLAIRFRDEQLEMWIGLDHATVNIDLAALARNTARFDDVVADGIVYRLRTTMPRPPDDDRRSKAFPPIDGFTSPPIREPREKKDGKPWTIEVREVTGSVREVWTMEYHFQGEATLKGGFRVAPRQEISVSPSVMIAKRGSLAIGNDEVVRGEDWRLDAQVHPLPPGAAAGTGILAYLDFALHQHGQIVSVAPLTDVYLPRDIHVSGGAGPLAIDVHVDHGVVQPDARAAWHTDDVRWKAAPLSGHADLDVVADVGHGPGGDFVRAVVNTARAGMAPATSFRDIHGEVDLGSANATLPVTVERVAVAIAAAHVGDAHAWQPVVGKALRLDGGAITASTRAEYRGGALQGRIDVQLDKLAFGSGPFAAVTSGTSVANIVGTHGLNALSFPGARVDLHDTSVRLLDGHADGMWLVAASNDARVAVVGRGGAHLSVRSGPGENVMKLFTRMASLPDIAADLTHGRELDANLDLGVREDGVKLDIDAARNGAITSRGRIEKHAGRRTAGAFLVRLGKVGVGVALREDGVSVRPLAGDDWLESELAPR